MKFKFVLLILLVIFSFNLVSSDSYGEPIIKDNYEISRSKMQRTIVLGNLFTDSVRIKNMGERVLELSFSIEGEVAQIADLLNSSVVVYSGNEEDVEFLIKAKEVGEFTGNFNIFGDVNQVIPITLNITEEEVGTPFLLEVTPLRDKFNLGKDLFFQTHIKKLKREPLDLVSFEYFLHGINTTYQLGKESKEINGSYNFVKNVFPPENLTKGEYVFEIVASHSGFSVSDKARFVMKRAFMQVLIFGFLPMWLLILILSLFIISFLTIYFIKKHIEGKKKYKMKLDLKSIPKKNEDFLFLGHVAETKHPAYLDSNKLTTHSIVAGATGGGKSISAQVMIEEVLKKNIAVIVFDPTAQWSGMLRKCTDKKMMSFYSKFGMKPNEAQGFKGNVRMIKNSRQVIDINKY